jgi:hypothetical protein
MKYSAFFRYWKKWEHNGIVHHLFIDCEKGYDSVRIKALYNTPTEFGIAVNL